MQQQLEELKRLAGQIIDWKNGRGWSHAQLTRQFRGIGSDRSLQRAAKGEPTGQVVAWLTKYRAAWEAIRQYDTINVVVRESLPLGNITPGCQEVLELINASDRDPKRFDRLVIIEGGSGAGKSETLKTLVRNLAGAAVLIDGNDTWRSAHAACGDILKAVQTSRTGKSDVPVNKHKRLNALLTELNKSKTVLLVDEAHHGAGSFLNLLKTILNQTPTVIAIAAIPTIWRKISSTYADESLQLQHNRLFARVVIPPASDEDVKAFLAGTVEVTDEEAILLASLARTRGHFSYLRRIREAVTKAAAEGHDMSVEEAIEEARYSMEGS